MKLDFAFKKIDASQALMEYVRTEVLKLGKYELKPLEGNVTFSMQRHECKAEIHLIGQFHERFHAEGISNDLYAATDMMVERLIKQMKKSKEKHKHHKRPENTDEYKLEHMVDEQLTPHYEKMKGVRKVG